MASPAQILAQPLELPCGATLPNRLVKAAMSENLAPGGAPSDRLIRLYERLGRGGASMLLSGNVIVDPGGRTEPDNVVVFDGRHLAGLRRWADAAQANGSKLWMQISHAGRQTPRMVTWHPVAPSAVGLKGLGGVFSTPRPLDVQEVRELVRRFGVAAGVAKEAGFTGVQVHGAHGYLVSQFLSPRTNKREDEYGGSLEGRMRFLLEVVRSIRTAVGPEFPVAVKLNSADFQRGGFTLDEAMQVAKALEAESLDLLEVTGGNYEQPAMVGSAHQQRESTRSREAFFLDYAEKMRQVVELPIMLTGGVRSADVMANAVKSGAVDLIGLARPMAVWPDLPRQLLREELEAAREISVYTGVRRLDDLLQTTWYQLQLHRMADGREPDPEMSKWWTIVRVLGGAVVQNFKAARAGRRATHRSLAAPGAVS